MKSFYIVNKLAGTVGLSAMMLVATASSVNRMPGIIEAPSAVPTGDQADLYNRVADTFNPDQYLDDYLQTDQSSESTVLPEASEAETQVSGI